MTLKNFKQITEGLPEDTEIFVRNLKESNSEEIIAVTAQYVNCGIEGYIVIY